MSEVSLAEVFHFPERFEQWSKRSLEERLQLMAWFTRSLDRRRREYRRMGWVYAMRNPALKEQVFKVGLSRRFPYERADELTRSTGVFGSFELVYFVHVDDCHAAEAEAHRLLAAERVSQGKEFFRAPLNRILEVLDEMASRYPVYAGPRRSPKPLAQPFWLYQGQCQACGAPVSARELLIPVRARCKACSAVVSFRA